jgi:hypothetical protein
LRAKFAENFIFGEAVAKMAIQSLALKIACVGNEIDKTLKQGQLGLLPGI